MRGGLAGVLRRRRAAAIALLERGDAVADRELDQARQVLDLELVHHAAAVGVDALRRKPEQRRDLARGRALHDELQHLQLAAAQALERMLAGALEDYIRERGGRNLLAQIALPAVDRAHRGHHLAP